MLRRAHLDDGLPWSQMAVLVRSGVRTIPVLRRSLVAAGVPVAVASDEVPLARDPAVAPLLLALRVAADPSRSTDDEARELLTVAAGAGDARRACADSAGRCASSSATRSTGTSRTAATARRGSSCPGRARR